MGKDTGAVWRVVGAVMGEDGRKHGGSPVLISKDGRILAGAAKLQGKRLGDMKAPAEHTSHRADLKAGRDYETAKVLKTARNSGVSMHDLHRLAAEMQAHDKAHVEERTDLLRRAEKIAQSLGTSLRTLKARNAKGIDAASVKHLDQIGHELMQEHGSQFRGFEDAPGDRLLDMMLEDRPQVMSEAQAYREALEHLQEHGAGREEDDERADERPAWEDEQGAESPWDEEAGSGSPWDEEPDPWADEAGSVPFAMAGRPLQFARPLRSNVFDPEDDDADHGEHLEDAEQARRLLGMLAVFIIETTTKPRLQRKAQRLLRALRTMSAADAVRSWGSVKHDQGRLVARMMAWRAAEHRKVRAAALVEVATALDQDAQGRPGPRARAALQAVIDLDEGIIDAALLQGHLDPGE